MVGRRRVYRPYSKEKIKTALYNVITARMGAAGTESILLQLHALNYSTLAAEAWDKYGKLASDVFNELKPVSGLTGTRLAGLRAMVGAAIKLHKMCERGRVVTRAEAREHITAAGRRAGLTDDEIARVIDRLVSVGSCERLA
ncbi:MAG: hypothetical protein LM577_07085 [Thermoproteaceae archaeon]|nr:hypothetical protein [Thermoproteaceae archaeon]